MNTTDSFGFIEVYGFVAGIEAADAMLKSAQVRLVRQHAVHPGMISLVVEGDLASCRAAVNAGVAAASRIGTVISSHVIGRPDRDTEMLVQYLLSDEDLPQKPTPPPAPTRKAAAPVRPVEVLPEPEPIVETPPVAEAPVAEPVAEDAPERERAEEIPAAPDQPDAVPAEVLEFILKMRRGRSWNEIIKHFPGLAKQVRRDIDALVASGVLEKVGARYRKPADKE